MIWKSRNSTVLKRGGQKWVAGFNMFSSETEARLARSCWPCFPVNAATQGGHRPASGILSAVVMGRVWKCVPTRVWSLSLSAHPQTFHTQPPSQHPQNPSVVFSCKFDICSEDRTCSWRYQPQSLPPGISSYKQLQWQEIMTMRLIGCWK